MNLDNLRCKIFRGATEGPGSVCDSLGKPGHGTLDIETWKVPTIGRGVKRPPIYLNAKIYDF